MIKMPNFGCLPDPKDERDYKAKVKLAERAIALEAMPNSVDFRVKAFGRVLIPLGLLALAFLLFFEGLRAPEAPRQAS